MTTEVQNWILTGAVAFLLMVNWWSVRNWMGAVTKKIDQLIEAVHKLSESNIRHAGEINSLSRRVDTADRRLNDHSNRIKHLEIKTGNGKV